MQDMNLSKARVLVADDDEAQRAFYGDLLKGQGSEIKLDGEEYLIMNEDDILGILTGVKEPVGAKK